MTEGNGWVPGQRLCGSPGKPGFESMDNYTNAESSQNSFLSAAPNICPAFLSPNGGQDDSALLSLPGLYPLYGPFLVVSFSFPMASSRDIACDTAALASLGLRCHTHCFLTADQTILAERSPALRRCVGLISEGRTPRQSRVPQRCRRSRSCRLQRRTGT